MNDAKTSSRPAAGLLLQLVTAYFAIMIILVIGLAYLFFQHDLNPYEVAGALVFLLIALIQSARLMVGHWGS